MYHFPSGYTARVAGTEKGVTEPQATFSTCFGAPFMPRHPAVYAKLLGEKIAKHGSNVWLVNTGWTGGAYGTGKRMSIGHTRSLIRAALEGGLADSPAPARPQLRPVRSGSLPGRAVGRAPAEEHLERQARLRRNRPGGRQRFEANFKQFADQVEPSVIEAGIKAAA